MHRNVGYLYQEVARCRLQASDKLLAANWKAGLMALVRNTKTFRVALALYARISGNDRASLTYLPRLVTRDTGRSISRDRKPHRGRFYGAQGRNYGTNRDPRWRGMRKQCCKPVPCNRASSNLFDVTRPQIRFDSSFAPESFSSLSGPVPMRNNFTMLEQIAGWKTYIDTSWFHRETVLFFANSLQELSVPKIDA